MTRFSIEGRTASGRNLFKDKPKKVKEKQRDTPPAIQLGEHGRYQIKSGRLAGEFVARAFPKPPTKARGLIAEATGATEEAAIAALHDAIDAREVRRTEERRTDPRTGTPIPSTEEFVEAIGQVALSRPQSAMLLALALAEDDGLTEARMTRAAGYKSQASANRAFAAAGLLVASYLSVQAQSNEPPQEVDGPAILGFRGEPRTEDDLGNWILHRELREAVRSMN